MSTGYDDKEEARRQWNNDPCGFPDGDLEPGTDEFYRRVDYERYAVYAPWLPGIIDREPVAGKRVLEIGFGMGTDLFRFARGGARVSGVDLSRRHLAIARQRFQRSGFVADLRLADAEALPFGEATFDLVYSFGVIHHTPGTQRVIDEIHRVLKPGGTALLAVYHRNSAHYRLLTMLSIYLARLRFLRESRRSFLSRIEHRSNSDACPLVKVYSRGAMRRMLHQFGRVELTCRHLEWSHFGMLRRVIPKRLMPSLEQRLGWYLLARTTKPLAEAAGVRRRTSTPNPYCSGPRLCTTVRTR